MTIVTAGCRDKKKRMMRRSTIAVATAALLATTISCQADVTGGSGGTNNSLRRRTRGEDSIRGGIAIHDIIDDDDSDRSGINSNRKLNTFLIKFRDGLAQTRSLEIHHNHQRHRHHREARGEEDELFNGGGRQWQTRAKSISSISDERHIAIVEMDPVDEAEDQDVSAAAIYDELMADEDIELVEEVGITIIRQYISIL